MSFPATDDDVPPAPAARWTIVEAPRPTSLDDPDAWVFHAVADIGREIELEDYGYDDLALEARSMFSGMQHQEYSTKRRFVALREGVDPASGPPAVSDVVGHLFWAMPVTSNPHLGESFAFVRPAARGQGIGTALMDLGERLSREAGRTVLFTSTQHGVEPAPGAGALEPTTGAGRVPADAPGPRFLAARGYVLEQVERHSVLELPLAPELLERLGGEARTAAGPDYRTMTWTDEIPEEWVDQVAVLCTRMSTDAPSGGLDLEEDPWDAARVRTWLAQSLGKGHGVLTTVAEHVPTGTLAAFTILTYPKDREAYAYQDDTLVLREHRGHRLGMLVKVVNVEALAAVRPRTVRIHTWNAEENDHMLAINVALGFRPAGGSAGWQRRLAGAPPETKEPTA